jgi:hypothetical protein
MASDSFTNANFTPVEEHTAGGNTWAGLANVTVFGQISSNQLGFGEAFGIACRASNSTSDFCQVVCKGGDYDGNTKSVLVRSSGSVRGYELMLGDLSGDTIQYVFLKKNEVYLTHADITGLGKSRLVDHTLALKAIPSGSDVQLKGYLDGVELMFLDSSASDSANSTTYTDLAAESPLAAGNPAIAVAFDVNMDDANSRLDDWTDTEGGGGGGTNYLARARGATGGFNEMTGGF